MPEGDTIYRTAVRLRDVMLGDEVTRARSRDDQLRVASLVGHAVRAIEARGKHLLIHVGQQTVHSHLGMTGSWHVYAPGETWQKNESRAMLVLETRQVVVVCFSPRTLELLSPDALRRHPHLQRLGPDLLGDLLVPRLPTRSGLTLVAFNRFAVYLACRRMSVEVTRVRTGDRAAPRFQGTRE